jgi:F-type H+-transporting ATPase subunit b
MLEINPGLVVWTILTFLVVLVILRMAAWKPLLQMLQAREEKIRKQLEEADRARAEALALLEEHKRQLALAEEQSRRIILEGREMGDRMKAEILEKAQQSSRKMIDQAKEEIGREKQKALVELRAEVADLAIGAAGKILAANLDTPRQRALVDAMIPEVGKH